MSRFLVFDSYGQDADFGVEVNLQVTDFQATADTRVSWEEPAQIEVGQNSINKCRRFKANRGHSTEEHHFYGGVNVNSTCTTNYSWSNILNAK